MAATRASGTTAVRYGTMRENVLALTVVLADGRVDHHGHAGAQVRRRVRPDAALRRIRGHAGRHHGGDAEAASGARSGLGRGLRVRFHDRGAVGTVIATIQLGVPVARIELLDEAQIDAINRCSKTTHAGRADAAVRVPRRQRPAVAEHATTVESTRQRNAAATRFEWATKLEDRDRLWQARHDALYAALALRPGCARLDKRTSACRSHGSPNASSRRSGTTPAHRSRCASSATPATATST